MKRSLATSMLLALTAALLTLASSTAAPPLQVDFVKHLVDPDNLAFEGTVTGAVSGGLASRRVSLDGESGPVQHLTFEWKVSGAHAFTALTSGTLNTRTGAVVMNGRVVDGYLTGARVHEEGQLVDPGTFTFAGFLRLMPSTAD
jgi:hypothetical protein